MVYDAVRAVATGTPRGGREAVGVGTYNDARDGWTKLAKEYAVLPAGGREVGLFVECGAVLSRIEYNGDADEEYLREAGGAMARVFFL